MHKPPISIVPPPAEENEPEVIPPAELAWSGQRLWVAVLTDLDLDAHERLLLLQACRVADRLDRLSKASANAPLTVFNGRGDEVANPLLTEARQQQIVLSRLLASLRLPSGESDGELQRPQRRGASRGSYQPRTVRK